LSNRDANIRTAAFQFLERVTSMHGEVLPKTILSAGFQFEGRRVPLIAPQGIFKPAVIEKIPLSITTVPEIPGRQRPYKDSLTKDGYLCYKYRGKDPAHRDNVGLRAAFTSNTPLIYNYGIVPGRYLPIWPIYIIADDPANLSFTVEVDAQKIIPLSKELTDIMPVNEQRRYSSVLTVGRLHQASFREKVLQAYKSCCAMCSLNHVELLEAAHILPDSHPKGEPVVSNGISLCKIHHAAYDRMILGITPDCVIKVREDVLEEVDGPMLRYGLQNLQDSILQIPRRQGEKPNPEFLEERFGQFLAVS